MAIAVNSLDLVDAALLFLKLEELLKSLLERNKFTLGLGGLVITVTDVDRAGLLFLSTNDCEVNVSN